MALPQLSPNRVAPLRSRMLFALVIALAIGLGASATAASAATIRLVYQGDTPTDRLGDANFGYDSYDFCSPGRRSNDQYTQCTITIADGSSEFFELLPSDAGVYTALSGPNCNSNPGTPGTHARCDFAVNGDETVIARYSRSPISTSTLTASPSVDGQGNLRATYVSSQGQPVKGKTITFTAPDQNGNTKTLCVAKTNAQGVAACNGGTFAKSFAAREGVLYTATSDDGLSDSAPLANARTAPSTATVRAVAKTKHRAHGKHHKTRPASSAHR